MKKWVLFITLIMVCGVGLLGVLWPGIENRITPATVNLSGMSVRVGFVLRKAVSEASEETNKKIQGLSCQFLNKEGDLENYAGLQCALPLLEKTGITLKLAKNEVCERFYLTKKCQQVYLHEEILKHPEIKRFIEAVLKNPCPYLAEGNSEAKLTASVLGCGGSLPAFWVSYVDENANLTKLRVLRD